VQEIPLQMGEEILNRVEQPESLFVPLDVFSLLSDDLGRIFQIHFQ